MATVAPSRPRVASASASTPAQALGPLQLTRDLTRLAVSKAGMATKASGRRRVGLDDEEAAKRAASDAFLRTRLQAVLDPRSTSQSPREPSPAQVLAASLPLLQPDRSAIIDPHITQISRIISQPHQTSADLNSPYSQRMIADVLAACWFRAAEGSKKPQQERIGDSRSISESFATFLIRECAHNEDVIKVGKLLDILEGALQKFRDARLRFRIPTPMVAAWAVLLTKTGRTPSLAFTWPDREKVVAYIEKTAPATAPEVYSTGLDSLLGSRRPIDLPTSLLELENRLAQMRASRDRQGRFDLWTQFSEDLRIHNKGTQVLLDPTIRSDVLAVFLNAFMTPASRGIKWNEATNEVIDEILRLFPRPLPRKVHHLLLARRARLSLEENEENDREEGLGVAEPGFGEARDVRSLDEQPVLVRAQDRHQARANLHAAWKDAGEAGRDLKMYMLYMEGLGRMGDLQGLQAAWNALVADDKCRQMYLAGEKGQYPPTRALNLMISAALLIPRLGPPVALQLFDQAIQPNSSISPDLITINTMLRHHARTPDLSAMSSLFSLAEKLKLKPDIVTYTTLVQGLLRAGELEMAKKTFGTMAAQGLEPNERMCSMLVADLAKSGRSSGLANAEDLLAEMRRRKMKIGVITWTALISGYFRGGWEEDAWAAVKRMEDQGMPLNRVAYNILLRQSGDIAQERGKGWSISLFERMIKQGVNPSSDTYVIVLAPLIRAKRWNLADNVVRHMDKLGFVPEKGGLRMLIRKVRQRRANI
ncbi:hypothetical protein JCM24511_05589 [Saitozyma sp. JCM 24511]|nr:hypothetical protein JCM24511_05589 [Saitozyma sp. JCM 24511]